MTAPQTSAPASGQPGSHDAPKQLRRSRRDHVIGGVCGGLGQYLGIDAVVVRIVFVALTLAGGSGVLLYIIAWIAMPEVETSDDVTATFPRAVTAPQVVVGAALLLVGVALLASQVVPGIDRYLWPLLLVGAGATILIRGEQR